MSRRKFITLARVLLSLLVIAAMGSSRIISFASDYDQTLISVEESEQAVYEKGNQGEGTRSDGSLEGLEEPNGSRTTEDACFFILKGIDADIPYEPAGHPTSNYSDAIRIDNAVNYTGAIVGENCEDSQEALEEDSYTIRNEVTSKLNAWPSVEQIQGVAPYFDPCEHFIVWYVIKRTTTAAPNGDVTIHVDGVIKKRVYSEYNNKGLQPDEPAEPEPSDDPIEEPVEEPIDGPVEDTVSSEYIFNIYTRNFAESFEYDGQEHIIGGYVIEVLDKETGELLQEFDYGPYGNRLGMRNSFRSSDGDSFSGTVFYFNGASYIVNVDSAYLSVTEPGLYSIPFLKGGKEISLDDIRIWDESGKLIDTGISKNPKGGSDKTEVSKRRITITAGSTVQNDNGQTITNDRVNITSGSLIEGHQLVTTIVGSQTGPGTSSNEITSYDIIDESGKSVKKYYNVSLVKGQLVLVPVSKDGTENVNSTGSAVTNILVRDQEKTIVVNKPVVLGAQRDQDGNPESVDGNKAYGVRSADTSDTSFSPGVRLSLIILCIMIIMVINIKRNKQNKS